ncbi:CHASE2 domain-containing protein [bacterium]|nr:CHASE2 domain-containing protein [bacterium]
MKRHCFVFFCLDTIEDAYTREEMKNFIKEKPLTLITAFVIALAWIGASAFLQSTAVFQDLENRWQKFYYDFRLVLPGTPHAKSPPIVLVKLDDPSLPEGTCRSPVDYDWLSEILEASRRQSPKVVGLNIVLEHANRDEDIKLETVLLKMNNVVLLDHQGADTIAPFKRAAKSWGSMSYRTNSSRDIQYVCDSPELCVCDGVENCQDKRIFYREIWRMMFPGDDSLSLPAQSGWLKLLFLHSAGDIHEKSASKVFSVISAKELLQLKPGSFQPGSLVLIGSDFQGLYPRFRIPLQQLSSLPYLLQNQTVTSLELTALVTEMVLSGAYLLPVPYWLESLLLLICLGLVTSVTRNRISFLPLWIGLFVVLCWNLTAALLFAYSSLEINSLVPSLAILSFSLYQIRRSQIQVKLEKLELENLLQQERFDNLVEQFHTHSVFNALEHIRFLIRTQSPNAEKYLLEYSTLLLDDLRHDTRREYTLLEQWEYIKNYLSLQNLKHENRIQLEFDLEPGLRSRMEDIFLPWKLFYPLVENAFKYTEPLLRKKNGLSSQINVVLKMENKRLSLRVINSFSGSEKTKGTRQGIINLKKRLGFLYPTGEWSLTQTREDQFWISTLLLPLIRHKK